MSLGGDRLKKTVEFLVNHYDKDSLPALLREVIDFNYQPRVQVSNFEKMVRDVLDLVTSEGFLDLTLFTVLASRPTDITAESEKVIFKDRPALREGLSLSRLLRAELNDVAVLRSAFNSFQADDRRMKNFVRSQNLPQEFSWNFITVVCMVIQAEETNRTTAAARQPQDSVLWKFLCFLWAGLEQDSSRTLQEWWTEHATVFEIDIPPEPLVRPDSIPDPEADSIMIRLIESRESTANSPLFLYSVFSYTPSQQSPDSLNLGQRQKIHEPVSIPQIRTLLEELRECLTRNQCLKESTLFEFVVSGKDLFRDFDQWRISTGFMDPGTALGFEHPVTVRFEEPVTYKIQKRWETLQKLEEFDLNTHVQIVTEEPAEDPYPEYETDAELMCVVVCRPIKTVGDITSCKPLTAAIRAGVPIVIWSREETAAQQLGTCVADVLADSPRQIWRQIFENVRRNLKSPFRCHLTLVLEQAYFLPSSLSPIPLSGPRA